MLIYSGQWDVVARMHDRGDVRYGVLPIDARLDALLGTIEQWLPIGG